MRRNWSRASSFVNCSRARYLRARHQNCVVGFFLVLWPLAFQSGWDSSRKVAGMAGYGTASTRGPVGCLSGVAYSEGFAGSLGTIKHKALDR